MLVVADAPDTEHTTAAALATFAGERLHPANAYTIPLKRKGITLPKNEDIDLLDTVMVSTVMQPLDGALHPWTTLAEAAEFFDTSTHHGAPVLSDRDLLVGILTISDITRAGGPSFSVTVSAPGIEARALLITG